MFWTYTLLITVAIVSVVQAYIQWRKDHAESPSKSKKIFYAAITILLLTAITGGRQIYFDNKESGRKDSLQNALNKKSDELLRYQKKDSTNTSRIIALQDNIIKSQNNSLNQITGGNSKPIVTLSTIGRQRRQLLDGKITNETQYNLNFTVINTGKYYIKNLNASILDHYNKVRNVVSSSGTGDYSYDTSTLMDQNKLDEMFYNNYSLLDKDWINKQLNVLPPNESKTLLKTRAPTGVGIYSYKFNVEWMNGSYTSEMSFKEKDTMLYLWKYDIYKADDHSKTQTNYFDLKLPKLFFKYWEVCGIIEYQGVKYQTYWQPQTKTILISHEQFDQYGVQNFKDWKCATKNLVRTECLKMLQYAYGN